MNTFGSSATSQPLRYPLYSAREVITNRERFRRDSIDDLMRANSLYVPAGRMPVRGWLLLSRRDYQNIPPFDTDLQLEVGDPTAQNNVATLGGLSIVQARCVTRGIASDLNALYLVEVTDARGILYNRWFQFPTNSKYNIRAPAYPDTFHPDSLNSGTTWTWATMLQNLWEQMLLLGVWPGLPPGVTISGTPEGFWFVGVSAWCALCDILDYLGLTVACNLTSSSPYTIVQPGAADATFTTLQTKYATNLEDDLEWIDIGAARVPGTVNVLFRRRNTIYGTEETVTYGDDNIAKQWDMASVYTVSVNAPAIFTGAVGTHYIWCDFTVRYDQNGDPLPADTATAAQIAQERVTQYFNRIYNQTIGSMTQVYAGALPFATGARVDGVCWEMDCKGEQWAGWRTHIVRGLSPVWLGLWDSE